MLTVLITHQAAQRSLRRMTWGGNRLKQLNFAAPAIIESTPLFPRTGNGFIWIHYVKL